MMLRARRMSVETETMEWWYRDETETFKKMPRDRVETETFETETTTLLKGGMSEDRLETSITSSNWKSYWLSGWFAGVTLFRADPLQMDLCDIWNIVIALIYILLPMCTIRALKWSSFAICRWYYLVGRRLVFRSLSWMHLIRGQNAAFMKT